MKLINKIINIGLICLCTFSFSACKQNYSMKKENSFSLGTVCSLSLPTSTSDRVFSEAFSILDKVEETLSRTKFDSYIYDLNLNKEVVVSQEIYNLIKKAYSISEISDGAFNPSIGVAVRLWDIGGANPRVPSENELATVVSDYNKVIFDDDNLTVKIPSEMEVDLGAIGKGYAADLLREYLISEGIERAIINLGGNVLLIGKKNKKDSWVIGLQDPLEKTGISYILLSLEDVSIVTSGAYERFFVEDGVSYHHILSPKTLYPSSSDILSSSIIGEDSTLCDSLSTTCFIMGSEASLELLKNFPSVSAIFLLKDNSIIKTDNFKYEYKIVNSDYYFR